MSDRLIEAAYAQRLGSVAADIVSDTARIDADERQRAQAALDACERIDERARREAVEIEIMAREVVPAARSVAADGLRQRHAVTLEVSCAEDAMAVAERLKVDGFEPWDRWTGAAHRSFLQHGTHVTLARTGAVSVVARVRWAKHPTSGWRALVGRLFRPTAGDWSMVSLPAWAWPAYSLARPVRQLLERVGLRSPHADSLGPFLATPDALLAPLLTFAEANEDDVVVDIGCGDARLPVAASRTLGCRSLGIEISPELAERGRRRAADAGVESLVTVITGEARHADLADATVVFMFLPVDVVPDLLPGIRAQLQPGARIVTHEQSRPAHPGANPPDHSELVVSDTAITVAHRWDL